MACSNKGENNNSKYLLGIDAEDAPLWTGLVCVNFQSKSMQRLNKFLVASLALEKKKIGI